jgi:hypothetical protein
MAFSIAVKLERAHSHLCLKDHFGPGSGFASLTRPQPSGGDVDGDVNVEPIHSPVVRFGGVDARIRTLDVGISS